MKAMCPTVVCPVAAGDYSKRATKPEIHVNHLQFSPTGECVGRCYDTERALRSSRQLIGAATKHLCTEHDVCLVRCC